MFSSFSKLYLENFKDKYVSDSVENNEYIDSLCLDLDVFFYVKRKKSQITRNDDQVQFGSLTGERDSGPSSSYSGFTFLKKKTIHIM